MKYRKVANYQAIARWMNERINSDIRSEKGVPPKGAMYPDGTPIPVDEPYPLKWVDNRTGDSIAVLWEDCE